VSNVRSHIRETKFAEVKSTKIEFISFHIFNCGSKFKFLFPFGSGYTVLVNAF
jgi:hypothetical protein